MQSQQQQLHLHTLQLHVLEQSLSTLLHLLQLISLQDQCLVQGLCILLLLVNTPLDAEFAHLLCFQLVCMSQCSTVSVQVGYSARPADVDGIDLQL